MDGGLAFSSPMPFVLMNWPNETGCMTFETEVEARRFVAAEKIRDPFTACGPLYGFSDGKWNRL